MNNLITESFERVMGRYPGEEVDDRYSSSPAEQQRAGMEGFFKQVVEIEKQIDHITYHFQKLQGLNQESHHVTKAGIMKGIKEEMEVEVEKAKKMALEVKSNLESLDRDNLANRRRAGCEKGTGIDRSRTSMTLALKKRLRERITQFENLRESIHQDYREVVARRVFTVTGATPDEEMIDKLIEAGHGDQIFSKAIQGHGRGQIMDTLAEIQERRSTMLEIEKKIFDLQQMFMDMSVMVDAQGDMLDDIEAQVTKSKDHVQTATSTLKKTKELQKNTRKYACVAILIFLVIVGALLAPILLKTVKQW